MEWDPAPSIAGRKEIMVAISHNRRAMGDKNPRMMPLLEGVMPCMGMGRKSPRHAYLQTCRVSHGPWLAHWLARARPKPAEAAGPWRIHLGMHPKKGARTLPDSLPRIAAEVEDMGALDRSARPHQRSERTRAHLSP
jgi:hypothetical protein